MRQLLGSNDCLGSGLKLGQYRVAIDKIRLGSVNALASDLLVGSKNNNNSVLRVALVDLNQRTCRLGIGIDLDVLLAHALTLVVFFEELSQHVVAAAADNAHVRAGAVRCGHLVRALAAGAEAQRRSLGGLACHGQVGCVSGHVNDQRTGADNFSHVAPPYALGAPVTMAIPAEVPRRSAPASISALASS